MHIQPILIEDADHWNELVVQLPRHHLLQSWQWGQLKAAYGWEVERWAWQDEIGQPLAAAQLMHRSSSSLGPLPLKFTLSYCPRGPAMDWTKQELRSDILRQLRQLSRNRGAAFLKIDPDIIIRKIDSDQEDPHDVPRGKKIADWLSQAGWRTSPDQIQFRNTATINLTRPEAEILAAMKQKTRYNIRLAGRKGVEIRPGYMDDLDILYHMYAETSLRDGFIIRPPDYYRQAWGDFIGAGLARPLIAEVEGQPIAAVVIYRFGEKATYMYGMSRDLHRNKMPTHLLQWEAMRWAKSQGCRLYDFWGAPDEFNESDPMWGVYRFKQGFAPTTVITPGAWDWIFRPIHYWIYIRLMPFVLDIMRRRGRRRTLQSTTDFDY